MPISHWCLFCCCAPSERRELLLKVRSGVCPKTTASFDTNSCLCFLMRSHLTPGWFSKVAPGKVIQLLGGRQAIRYSLYLDESGETWEFPHSELITGLWYLWRKEKTDLRRSGEEILINWLLFSLFKLGGPSFSCIFLENWPGPLESSRLAARSSDIFTLRRFGGSVRDTWGWWRGRGLSACFWSVSHRWEKPRCLRAEKNPFQVNSTRSR